jgi:hypothetical protein
MPVVSMRVLTKPLQGLCSPKEWMQRTTRKVPLPARRETSMLGARLAAVPLSCPGAHSRLHTTTHSGLQAVSGSIATAMLSRCSPLVTGT